MGLRGSQTAELVFQDCRVPAENLVGEENHGVAVVMSGLDMERVGLAFLILGMAERALELAVDFAAHASSSANRSPSSSSCRAWWPTYTPSSSRCAASSTASARRSTRSITAPPIATWHCARPRSSCRRARGFTLIVDNALQVHGGTGYIWETEINRLYRAGKLLEIGAGTTRSASLIIARELLGR